ncbi:MAG: hypothetical protein M1825_000156 [Sarcosagium campestre]|nr:MAG: hypothetical protein M1825_000156 [Sarcosagium campestre]
MDVPPVDPRLTAADHIVLKSLRDHISAAGEVDAGQTGTSKPQSPKANLSSEEAAIKLLEDLNDEKSESFETTVLTGWDEKDIRLPAPLSQWLLKPYVQWARSVVRRPTDVVFLSHILIYLSTSLPSAIYLFINFSYPHAIFHWLMQGWYCGSFTLMLHNHIHNNGVLAKNYAWLDQLWPYILEPLMGHTWDSYYYHHVKHHHVEGNGPDDLSSTIRYQRDDLIDFLAYVGRFLFFIYFDLPCYFIRKRKTKLAFQSCLSETLAYLFIYALAQLDLRATIFVLLIPLVQMRIGMMVGNWGQHAFVDEVEPDSDYRSSITLIDVPSNRYCFNDGWHTSHHLNPRRHWRDHPVSFLKGKKQYEDGRALVLSNIDYLMITVKLMQKDYHHLAKCMVPIGDQVHLSHQEKMDLLRAKTRRFTEDDINKKFAKKNGRLSTQLSNGKANGTTGPEATERRTFSS